MSESLSDKFEVYRSLIVDLLGENALTGDCKVEIEAALDNIKSDLDNHDCADAVVSEEISLEDVLTFIEDDDGDTYPQILEALRGRGAYCISARNLNEIERVEKFIEELNNNPYAP